MFRISIAAKVFGGFTAVLLTFGGVILLSVLQFQQLGARLRLLNRGYIPLTTVATQLEALRANKQPDVARVLAGPPATLNRDLVLRLHLGRIFEARLARGARLVSTNLRRKIPAEERRFLLGINARFGRTSVLHDEYRRAVVGLARAVAAGRKDRYGPLLRQLRQRELDLRRSVRVLALVLGTRITQTVLQAGRDEGRAVWSLLLLSALAAVVGLVITILAQRPLGRIRSLTDMANAVGRGDLTRKVQLPGGDELSTLAEELNRMANSLQERDQHLAQQRQELERAYKELQDGSDQLLRSERLAAIGRLAAQITHEIRNPLNSMGLNLELLEDDIPTMPDPERREEAQRLVHAVHEELRRLTEITDEYLRFARLPPPQLESADLNTILADLVEFVEGELAAASVDIGVSLDEAAPQIDVDRSQLRQAFLNIFRNSMESMAGGGSLSVSTRPMRGGVQVQIVDSGPGIDQETLERIFDPFFSTKAEGTGLGLPLTQQIIAGHGGEIRCESEPGEGTRFVIDLPGA